VERGEAVLHSSLCAKITGRKIFDFDSFEGLPAEEGDREAVNYKTGDRAMPEVKENIQRYGVLDSCVNLLKVI